MFVSDFNKFIKLYTLKYKQKLLILFCLSLVAGFLEFLGIALIFPLILLILNGDNISNLSYISEYLSFIDFAKYALILSVFVVFAFVAKNIFMLLNNYFQLRVLKNWQIETNLKFMYMYLFSSYEDKLNMPAKYSLFQIWQIISIVFNNFVFRVMNFMTNLVIFLVIITFVVLKFKIWAVITIIFFLLSAFYQNNIFKTKGRDLTSRKLIFTDQGNRNILSALKNIKDIKIFSKEKYFYDGYKKNMLDFSRLDIAVEFLNSIPQNILEICIIFAIIIMSYGIVILSNGNSEVIIANLGMLAAAIFRLAPLVNKLQMNYNIINSSQPAVNEFFTAYECYGKMDINEYVTEEKLEVKNSIEVLNFGYSYGEKTVFSGLNLSIKKGEFVGIIGVSGVGKTTFVDAMMGFLSSYTGDICVDGLVLDKSNMKKWINTVGYVPQEVTLLPLSIASNIAFGVPDEKIDYERLNYVVRVAQLEEYVKTLKDGINSVVGDFQGMSQGQRQRIGIARALYKNPDILFLDEITSALDVETEDKITKCLEKLKGNKTIIAIAHRLTTLKKCDRIFYFKSEKEVLSGTMEELMSQDESFKNLVSLASIN